MMLKAFFFSGWKDIEIILFDQIVAVFDFHRKKITAGVGGAEKWNRKYPSPGIDLTWLSCTVFQQKYDKIGTRE